MKATVRKGFTLIEILIVVIILGILAAIVIPQFTSASDDAKRSSIRSTVQSIRGQIELYKLQHNDRFPTGTETAGGTAAEAFDFALLTGVTDVDAKTYSTTEAETARAAGTKLFGPYLQETPVNPFTGTFDIVTTPTKGAAWYFDTEGRFWGLDKDGGVVNQQSGKSTDTPAAGA